MGHVKSADPNVFILPDLGEGVHEAELIKWRVAVGQRIDEHQILADMETDKALVEVPSPRGGVLAVLHGTEGETLKVGNPLVTFVAEGGPAAGNGAPAGGQACDTGGQIARNLPAETNGKRTPASTSHAATPSSVEAKPETAPTEDAGTVVGAVGGALAGLSAAPGKALATPAVRRLARDLGVDIDTISGTGIGGRVMEKDVRAALSGSKPAAKSPAPTTPSAPAPVARTAAPAPAARPSAPPPPARSIAPIPAGEATQRVPFRGVRKTIANRLRESVSTAVHFTVMDEADVSELDRLRKKLAGASGEKLSFLTFVASALCRVLTSEFREFNATVDDPAEEIVRHRAVHMGIATDTDAGLMVPVIRDCDRLGVLEIGREIVRVAGAARDRSASRDMLGGSTFTISNVGSHAGRFATPVINYPEVGILAVGRARDGVVVRHGMLGVGKLLPLSLACDHRVVDGASAALALARIIELLQSPEQLLEPATQ